MKPCDQDLPGLPSTNRFINPHRLFHGMWMPQWLEERPEVSEKAKKLYCLPDLLRGREGLRVAVLQSSRGEAPLFLAGMSSSWCRSFPRTASLQSPTSTTQQRAIARITTDFFGTRGCRLARMVISAW